MPTKNNNHLKTNYIYIMENWQSQKGNRKEGYPNVPSIGAIEW